MMPQMKNIHQESGCDGLASSHFVATKKPAIARAEVM